MSMRVYLDSIELTCPGATLAEALEVGRIAAGSRLIVEARADGFEVPATDLEAPPTRSPYASRIDFVTADSAELIREMLGDAVGALDALSPRHFRAADQIRGGQIDQALLTLGEVLRTWAEVRSAMELASRAGPGPDPERSAACVRPPGTDLTPVLSGLADRLTEIKRTLVTSDWSSLADVLAYDMESQVRNCREWLVSARG